MLEWLFGNSKDSSPHINTEEILKELEKTRTERALALHEAMVERKNAYKLAEAKERFNWIASTGLLTSILSVVASFHHKNLMYSLPVVPISLYLAHQAHYAFGNKLDVIKQLSDQIILDPNAKLSTLPISLREIEARVEREKDISILECVDYSN
uniref:SMODS and SLOG-associating 2TM effector domain-containing protein n=1 Tax=Panagrolaimus superbus TaxID=310955 RepID=A0A914Z1Y3_9BILA